MIKNILSIALVATSLTFATGWDMFNPAYGGNAQIRTGVNINHDDESASTYTKARFIIKENVELSSSVTSGNVDWLAVKVDILNYSAVAVELHEEYAVLALQGYVDGLGGSFGSEINYSTDSKEVSLNMEADYYFFNHVQYAGFSYSTDESFSWYAGYVYPLEKVELGGCFYQVYFNGDYITSGYSLDITWKF